jgi:transposase
MTTTIDDLVSDAAGPGALLRQPGHPWRCQRDWQRAGVWQQLHHLLLEQLSRNTQLDWSHASLGSISVRAKPRHRPPEPASSPADSNAAACSSVIQAGRTRWPAVVMWFSSTSSPYSQAWPRRIARIALISPAW